MWHLLHGGCISIKAFYMGSYVALLSKNAEGNGYYEIHFISFSQVIYEYTLFNVCILWYKRKIKMYAFRIDVKPGLAGLLQGVSRCAPDRQLVLTEVHFVSFVKC